MQQVPCPSLLPINFLISIHDGLAAEHSPCGMSWRAVPEPPDPAVLHFQPSVLALAWALLTGDVGTVFWSASLLLLKIHEFPAAHMAGPSLAVQPAVVYYEKWSVSCCRLTAT